MRDRTNNGGEIASARGEGYRSEYGIKTPASLSERVEEHARGSRPRKAYMGMVGCTGMMLDAPKSGELYGNHAANTRFMSTVHIKKLKQWAYLVIQ